MSELPITIKHMNENYPLSTIDDRADGSQASAGTAAGSPRGAGPGGAGPGGAGPGGPEGPEAPLEWLEERICELAGHLAAGTCRFLQLVAEFDARRGWACWDLPSCAAWLAWKCQVAPGTAREQVRVARALAGLPVITAQFAAGRMSYAKIRALTRIATTATEAGLAEITGPMTAAQCERFAAAHRTASDSEQLASQAARRVAVHVAGDGSVTITARLPATDGAVVLQALRAAAGDCEHPHRPHPDPAEDAGPSAGDVPARTHAGDPAPAGPDDPAAAGPDDPAAAGPDDSAGTGQGTATCRASLADALVEVAGAYLSGKIAAAGNPDLYHVIVHVGPEALLSGPGPGEQAPGRPPGRPAAVPAETTPGNPPAGPAGVPAETTPGNPPAGPAGVPAETTPGNRPAGPAGVPAETPGNRPAGPAGVPAETPGNRPAGPAASPARLPAAHPAHPRRCHLDDGPAISPAAAQAIACHATVSWMLHDHDGTLLDAGRRHRRATAALRRAVRERDKSRCQFPGCNSRRTDIHHITAWANGGKTRLRDLISLCEAHHVIVHALGYLITPAPAGFAFTRPDGQPMPSAPALPESDADLTRCHDADITTDTIIPAGLADKLDLDLAIWACFANTRIDQQASQRHEQQLAA